jgi:hypothetical protein
MYDLSYPVHFNPTRPFNGFAPIPSKGRSGYQDAVFDDMCAGAGYSVVTSSDGVRFGSEFITQLVDSHRRVCIPCMRILNSVGHPLLDLFRSFANDTPCNLVANSYPQLMNRFHQWRSKILDLITAVTYGWYMNTALYSSCVTEAEHDDLFYWGVGDYRISWRGVVITLADYDDADHMEELMNRFTSLNVQVVYLWTSELSE